MLSEKEFDNLKWTELTDLTLMVGATITAVEPITDGERDVGVMLYLTCANGTKTVVDIGGDEPCNALIAEVSL